MKLNRANRNRRATILTDYLVLFGVVSLILFSMQFYIKRGIQGRVKEMTDYFIGAAQVTETDPTVEAGSESNSIFTSEATAQLLEGGRTRTSSLDSVTVEASSRSAAEEPEIKKSDEFLDKDKDEDVQALPPIGPYQPPAEDGSSSGGQSSDGQSSDEETEQPPAEVPFADGV